MINYKMVFILLLINIHQANAVTLTGGVGGSFLGGDTLLEWGVAENLFTGSQSSLEYIPEITFSTNDTQPFKIATLTYSNTAITQSSAISNTNLQIQLNFTTPSLGSFDLNYDLLIDETDNASADPDDRVTLVPSAGLDPFLAHIDGVDLSFELLGFDNGSGGFNNFFVQPENSGLPIDLYARISAVPIPSALWLFMTAITGTLMFNGRRQAKA